MGFGDVATEQQFPFAYDRVFDALIAVLPKIGFIVKTQDRVIGRVTADAGMSAFSFGESVAIQVQRASEAATNIVVQSNLKVGANWAGAGKNAQNAERIIAALSSYLQNADQPQAAATAAVSAAEKASSGTSTGYDRIADRHSRDRAAYSCVKLALLRIACHRSACAIARLQDGNIRGLLRSVIPSTRPHNY
jgi:hypothetical protein